MFGAKISEYSDNPRASQMEIHSHLKRWVEVCLPPCREWCAGADSSLCGGKWSGGGGGGAGGLPPGRSPAGCCLPVRAALVWRCDPGPEVQTSSYGAASFDLPPPGSKHTHTHTQREREKILYFKAHSQRFTLFRHIYIYLFIYIFMYIYIYIYI